MKIDEMYRNLQERYQADQEKKALQLIAEKAEQEKQEKEAKKELGRIITEIVEVTKHAIEAIPNDVLYGAYEEAKKTCKHHYKEETVNLRCYSQDNHISFNLDLNGDYETPRIGQIHYDFDRSSYVQLYKLLEKSYKGITFGSYHDTVIFSFNEGTIGLEFSLRLRALYAYEDDEKVKEETNKNVKRLSSNLKDLFPNAKTSRRGYLRDTLYVTFKLY